MYVIPNFICHIYNRLIQGQLCPLLSYICIDKTIIKSIPDVTERMASIEVSFVWCFIDMQEK